MTYGNRNFFRRRRKTKKQIDNTDNQHDKEKEIQSDLVIQIPRIANVNRRSYYYWLLHTEMKSKKKKRREANVQVWNNRLCHIAAD